MTDVKKFSDLYNTLMKFINAPKKILEFLKC